MSWQINTYLLTYLLTYLTLHYRYQEMINDYPELKCVFPAPSILTYRSNRNLGNLLVHTSLTKSTPNTSHPSGTKIANSVHLCATPTQLQTILQTKPLTLAEENVIPNIPFMLQNVQSTIYCTLVRVLRN